MINVEEQLELDFGNVTETMLGCGTIDTSNQNHFVYATNNTNTAVNPFNFQNFKGTTNINIDDGDIYFTRNGQKKSLVETISKIEERLSILVPNPEKLKQFEALKQAYENYKTLEALCLSNKE